MKGRRFLVTLPLLSFGIAACGSTPSRTPGPSASATAAGPSTSAAPSPSATTGPTPTAAPTGPLAVLYTNNNGQGTSYDVLLINVAGAVLARTTATLPSLKANQTLVFSPVAAAATHAYYRDGDTTIHSLAPDGTSAVVKTVSAASAADLAFAVSPDETRVAIALINEAQDSSNSSSHAYAEDIADSNNHVDLYDNTGMDAYRWPVAWFGNDIIDAIGQPCNGYGGIGNCITAMHSTTAGSGARVASICEAPNPEPYGYNDVRNIEGSPVAAGVTCYAYTSAYGAGGTTSCSLNAVSWTGAVHTFDTCQSGESYMNEGTCFLSPDGGRMACLDGSNGALAILTPDGHLRSLGRKYALLGWIDTTHMMVDVDSTHLAVVDVDSGTAASITLDGADHVSMAGVLGG